MSTTVSKQKYSKLQKNIWKLYLYKFFISALFSIPIFVLFWQNNGLNLTKIMLLQSLYSMAIVFLEIPTGYISDLYNRKNILILASLAQLIAIIIYSFGHNFFQFLMAELFFAFGVSLTSGTLSAFTYDTLKNLNQLNNYSKIWGNITAYGMISLAISSVTGGLISKINMRYTLFASIPVFVLALLVVITMQEPLRSKLVIKKNYLQKLILTIKNVFIKNTKLKWLIIYSGIIYAFNQSALWLYQPYFKYTGLDIAYFGFVFASFQIIAALSSKYAHKIEKLLGKKYSLGMLIFLITGSYFLMSNFIFLFSFSFAFIQQFVRSFRIVVINDYINKLAPSETRATILSLESFVGRLMYALFIPFLGWIADIYTIVQALEIAGFISLFTGIIILFIIKKTKLI